MRSLLYSKRFYYIVLFVVFVLHLGSLALKRASRVDLPLKHVTKTEPIKIKIIDHKVLESLRLKKQIVESDDSASNQKPKDSRFFSDKNRSFDRETRARKNAPFQKAAKGENAITFQGKGTTPSAKGSGGKKSLKNLKLSDLAAYSKTHDPFKAAAKESSGSMKGIRQGSPLGHTVSSTNDYLADVPPGDFTHLNTQEYKYYGFYHRIKTKLEQFWSRSIHEKAQLLARAGRSIASAEVVTSLKVTMDESGEITAIKVIGPSGVKELDDAAIESFNDAGPFPYPPKGLVVNGQVEIEWGFVVNT